MRVCQRQWYVIGIPPGGEAVYLVTVVPEDRILDGDAAIAGVLAGEFGYFFRGWLLRSTLLSASGKAFETGIRALLHEMGVDDTQAAFLGRLLRTKIVDQRWRKRGRYTDEGLPEDRASCDDQETLRLRIVPPES